MLAPEQGLLEEINPLLEQFHTYKTHHSTKKDRAYSTQNNEEGPTGRAKKNRTICKNRPTTANHRFKRGIALSRILPDDTHRRTHVTKPPVQCLTRTNTPESLSLNKTYKKTIDHLSPVPQTWHTLGYRDVTGNHLHFSDFFFFLVN
jgi:hypothetical protein